MTPADSHNGGAIYLMVDAHVERKAATAMPYDAVAKARMPQTMWWYYRKKP